MRELSADVWSVKMMEDPQVYTEDEQDIYDIEWFACDKAGSLGYFTSRGKPLPPSVAQNKVSNELISEFAYGIHKIHRSKIVCIKNPIYSQLRAEEISIKKHGAHLWLASCGLFAFDTSGSKAPGSNKYFIAAYPVSPVSIFEFPEKIQAAIRRTAYDGNFLDSDSYEIGNFISYIDM